MTYDRETDTRIPQVLGKPIEGEIKGKDIETFPVVVTTWKNWKTQHPKTLVLSQDTGFSRDYNRNPYPGYDKIYRLWFPVAAESDELRTKDYVLGIENNGEFLAVEKEGFAEKYPEGLEIDLGNEAIKVTYNKEFQILEAPEADNYFEVFWFAWYAYHPDTELIKNDQF